MSTLGDAFDADVIIAGAGMAGSTLALALAGGGLKTILVDPQPFAMQTAPSFDGRASAISFAAYRQWRALAATDPLDGVAQRIEQIVVTDGVKPGAAARPTGGACLRFEAAEIADRCDGEPLGYMLENRHIRAGLAQAVAAAGIRVLAPESLTGLEAVAGGMRVHLGGGGSLTAPLIVGADGRTSRVRRQSGITTTGWNYGQSGVVATVALERDHQGVAYEHFLPAGPFAILPLTQNRASLVWTESVERGASLNGARDTVFAAHLVRRFGDFLGRIDIQGPRFVYPLSLQLADRIVAPRTALVGDAAHVIHPIAGQGLNMGLKDAAALAQVVIEAARRGEDIGAAAVLARYARWRSLDNIGVSLATDLFNRLFSNSNPVLRAARGAGMRLVGRTGPARRFFMAEAGGATGDLPRLLRGVAV